MNFLNLYKPSVERIYGNKFSDLRSTFQTVLVVLSNVENLNHTSTVKECDAQFEMLKGAITRHFDLQQTYMLKSVYTSIESHLEHHKRFQTTVEEFCIDFAQNSNSKNLTAFRCIQKELLHHLLMDDAHLINFLVRNEPC